MGYRSNRPFDDGWTLILGGDYTVFWTIVRPPNNSAGGAKLWFRPPNIMMQLTETVTSPSQCQTGKNATVCYLLAAWKPHFYLSHSNHYISLSWIPNNLEFARHMFTFTALTFIYIYLLHPVKYWNNRVIHVGDISAWICVIFWDRVYISFRWIRYTLFR